MIWLGALVGIFLPLKKNSDEKKTMEKEIVQDKTKIEGQVFSGLFWILLIVLFFFAFIRYFI